MARRIYILCMMLAAVLQLQAQALQEYTRAVTDKDCYLTGEQMLVKVNVTDESGKPLTFSKVAYVELCDGQGVQAQCMVQLTDGEGWAAMDLPNSMHSGNYLMSVYTRYMRNFSPEHYARKVLPVVNLMHTSETDRVEWMEGENPVRTGVLGGLQADRASYGIRSRVQLALPAEAATMRSLTLSVSRRDLSPVPVEMPRLAAAQPEGQNHFPEMEGHVVTARQLNGHGGKSVLAAVGQNAILFEGQQQPDGTTRYYTSGLTGNLPVVINRFGSEDAQAAMETVSPYQGVVPEDLPVLKMYYDRNGLNDRSVGMQVQHAVQASLPHEPMPFNVQLKSNEPARLYDLDEWTRFKTVREIILEFVTGINRRKVGDRNQLFISYVNGIQNWPAMVLLDGAPISDVDELLQYDARRLKYLAVYDGRYTFGENIWNGVISFMSHRASLSDIYLPEDSQMFTYAFPQDRPAYYMPVYDTPEMQQSPAPDFRHTLYWNPDLKPGEESCSFYTSDLTGTFHAVLTGLDAQGHEHHWDTLFTVE